jgi:anti-sigma-K factor RskA
MTPEDMQALAAEYVLGTLDEVERGAADARMAADPDFRAAVAEWERRIQPLADSAGPEVPSEDVWQRIVAQIDGAGSQSTDNVVQLRRSVSRWRAATLALAAAAAALVAVVVLDRTAPAPQSEFVAVLTGEGGTTPAFVATVDVATRSVQIVRVAAPPPAGKSYELWSIGPDNTPRSMGLLQQASLKREINQDPSAQVTFAVSLEDQGGSTTGLPQGPVVFKGTLLPAQ